MNQQELNEAGAPGYGLDVTLEDRPDDVCADPLCEHRRDRHIEGGGAHPCLRCVACRGFAESLADLFERG